MIISLTNGLSATYCIVNQGILYFFSAFAGNILVCVYKYPFLCMYCVGTDQITIYWLYILQGVVFSVMSKPLAGCPGYFVTQCVDLRISAGVNLKPYYVYTMIISFFAPLVCILVCYILIAIAISKMAKISKGKAITSVVKQLFWCHR